MGESQTRDIPSGIVPPDSPSPPHGSGVGLRAVGPLKGIDELSWSCSVFTTVKSTGHHPLKFFRLSAQPVSLPSVGMCQIKGCTEGIQLSYLPIPSRLTAFYLVASPPSGTSLNVRWHIGSVKIRPACFPHNATQNCPQLSRPCCNGHVGVASPEKRSQDTWPDISGDYEIPPSPSFFTVVSMVFKNMVSQATPAADTLSYSTFPARQLSLPGISGLSIIFPPFSPECSCKFSYPHLMAAKLSQSTSVARSGIILYGISTGSIFRLPFNWISHKG